MPETFISSFDISAIAQSASYTADDVACGGLLHCAKTLPQAVTAWVNAREYAGYRSCQHRISRLANTLIQFFINIQW
ncbi:hypothetical protein KCP78_17445 [Salmonella enterica subsp. enterica]|nr:hypothetical protein KCP78_17445 [Salmonella enterica subsp. enterica]